MKFGVEIVVRYPFATGVQSDCPVFEAIDYGGGG